MPYSSARDLPKVKTLLEQVRAAKFMLPLLPLQWRQNLRKLNEIRDQIEEIVVTVEDFYAKLGPRNWIFHESFDVERMKEVLSEPTAEQAERALINYYKDEAPLDRWVMGIAGLPEMRTRIQLVNNALVDYRAERYYSTVLVLIPVIDGFVNDFERVRRGLHTRNANEVEAWNSVVGHELGLPHVLAVFQKPVMKTITEPVYDLYRHGLVHGMVVDFDNDVIATKAWNLLFAIAEWARSTEAEKDEVPPPTLNDLKDELLKYAAHKRVLDRDKELMKDFEPGLVTDHAILNEDSAVNASVEFLTFWQQENYGFMAQRVNQTMVGNRRHGPAIIRNEYQGFQLTDFEVLELRREGPGASSVRAMLTIDGDRRGAALRWIFEDGDGHVIPSARSEDGSWRLCVWGPEVMFRAYDEGGPINRQVE